MARFKDFFSNLMLWTARMTASQVMMLLGVSAGTIVGIIMVVGWFNDANYARLYSDLDESQAGEIITYLSDQKVPYKLTDGGRAIEVPSGEVYRLRISLAADGLPQAGVVGYSIFDQNNFGMTDFIQNLNFRRALEGELTRTIMQLNEVQAARVHIVMPKDKLFREDRREATASVVLKLRGSGGLERQQIDGISHLVASSVEGLSPANITIIDYNGNMLSSGQKTDVLAGLSNSQLDVRQKIEQHLQGKAQSMLDDVLGSGKAVIRVTADLDFQQLERTSETYDPNAPSIRSEMRTKGTVSIADKSGEANENTQEDTEEITTTNYELNKTVEHLVKAVGSIKRLSIAVMVDGVYSPVETDGVVEMVYQPRSQEELDRLSSIVKNAVGYDQQRNDQIEMVNIAFERQNLDADREALDAMYQREFYMDIGKNVGLVLLAAFMFLYFRKKATKLFATLGSLMPAPVQRAAEPKPEPEPEEIYEEVKPIEAKKRKPRLVDQMQKTAKEEPEEIARVIKTMMVEAE